MRPVVSVDLGRMDRVLEIDETSRLARVQAGVYGPRLEEQLNARGWTVGHFPDSFTHSTLGGWIATRSSGMQSDRYGDIADVTRGLRVVTPRGPAGSARPCRAPRPARACARWCWAARGGWGSSARRPCTCTACPRSARSSATCSRTGPRRSRPCAIAASEAAPSVTRVADANETAFSFATKKASIAARQDAVEGARRRSSSAASGFDLERDVPRLHRLRGHRRHVAAQRKRGRAHRRPPRRHLHRREPRRALRPEEVRHALHPRLPARPRRARRRVGDRRAVGRAPGPLRRRRQPPRAAPSPTSASRAT